MGNENEVRRTDAPGRSLFLPEEIHDQDGISEVYVLEEEFARTRKNRNWKLYIFITAFVAAVIGGVLIFKLVLDYLDRNVVVDVREFADLRLKEVIDSARKRTTNIDALRIDLQVLEIQMLEEMLRVRKDAHRREMDVLAQGLPDAGTDARVARIRSDLEARLKIVRAAYQARMRRKRAEIWSLEEARAKEEGELAKEGAEARVSNTDRMYALHMKNLREKQQTGIELLKKYYDGYADHLTDTYNPTFAGPVAAAVSSDGTEPVARAGSLSEYNPLLGEHGFSAAEFAALRKRIADHGLVLGRMMRVPYRNSVPPALRALDGLVGSIVRDYETIWTSLAGGLAARNRRLGMYEHAFDFVLEAKKEHGLVVDSRDPHDILVHMNRSLKIDEGQIASVYHGERYVGRVRLRRDPRGGFRAEVVTLAGKSASIRPANRIILDKKK